MSNLQLLFIVFFVASTMWLAEVNAQGETRQCGVILHQRAPCGGGNEELCRNRGCCYDNNVPSGDTPHCYFPGDQAPRFADWGSWEACSHTCGSNGRRAHNRQCLYPDERLAPTDSCRGSSSETEICNRRACTEGSVTTVTAAPEEECTDFLPTCTSFQQLCAGSTLGQSLSRFCKRTCNACDGPTTATPTITTTTQSTTTTTELTTRYPPSQCIDEYDTCHRVVDICSNATYVEELTKYCRATCNLCTAAELCEDSNAGRCSRFSSLCSSEIFQSSCPRTCNACPQSGDQTVTQQTTSPPTIMQAFVTEVVTTLLTTSAQPATTIVPTTTTTTTTEPTTTASTTTTSTTEPTTTASTTATTTTTEPTITASTTTTTTTGIIAITSITTTTDCQDELSYCDEIVQLCDDPIYANIMNQCQLTCGTCGSRRTEAQTEECVDTSTDCDALAPFCNSTIYGPFLQRNCRRTCNSCSSQSTDDTKNSTRNSSLSVVATTVYLPVIEFSTIPDAITSSTSRATTTSTVAAALAEECSDDVNYCDDILLLCGNEDFADTTRFCKRTCGMCPTSPVLDTTMAEGTTNAVTEETSTEEPRNMIMSMMQESNVNEDEECVDGNGRCAEVAGFCDDPEYRAVLSETCPLTCGVCSPMSSTPAGGASALPSTTTTQPTSTQPTTTQPTSTTTQPTSTQPTTTQPSTTTTQPTSTQPTTTQPTSTRSTTATPATTLPTTTALFSLVTEQTTVRVRGPCEDAFPVCAQWRGTTFCGVLNTLKVSCPDTCDSCVNGTNPYLTTTVASTTTTSPATAIRDPFKCEDNFQSICRRFLGSPNCRNNAALQRNCRRTCNLCGEFTVPTISLVTTTTTATTTAPTTTRDPNLCEDIFPSICQRYEGDPNCAEVASLQTNCRKTCRLCGDDAGRSIK